MNLREETARFLFLDFEASSLSQSSWPIEIGVSRLVNGQTVTRSSLIKPDPAWGLADWNPASQKIHGIDLEELQSAPPADEVAKAYYPHLSCCVVFSDYPEFEARWLNRLLATAGLAPVEIHHFTKALDGLLNDRQLDYYHERLSRLPVPHRAGPDSARFIEALKYAFEK